MSYILVLIGALLCAAASWNVNQTYHRYRRMKNRMGIPAEEAARRILNAAGIYDVRIERIGGELTDHYSPGERVLRLSQSVYGSSSVAALGVAAHECGHALQHQEGYLPLRLRSFSVPAANIGSWLSWPLIVLGLVLGNTGLAQVGVFLFVFVVAFQLITLPVEFDASGRALRILNQSNMLAGEELEGAKKVLSAAALTYVAALFSSILQLLRLVLITQNGKRRD